MEEFKQRLLLFVENLGQSVRAFEQDCGLANGTISSIKVKGPSVGNLSKIAYAHPELNLSWLLTGEGKMLRENQDGKRSDSTASGPGIPLLPFSAVAGSLSENTPIDSTMAIERFVIPDFSARGADCAIRVDGDSMYPRYSSGDILAIRIVKDPTFFQWGKVYVLSTNQGCVIKRLFPDPADDNAIICHSENTEHYPDYKITKQDIFGVAIVVGHAGIE